MKTIEEKAKQRAFEIASSLGLNIAELIVAIHDVYVEAATEALSGQWRSVDDDLPKENEDVFVRYANYVGGLEYGVAYYDGEDWYTTDDTHIRPIRWMNIPEPPKDKSE